MLKFDQMKIRHLSFVGRQFISAWGVLWILCAVAVGQDPRLSEYVLENVTTLADEDGGFPPWIEIEGAGSGENKADLDDFQLSGQEGLEVPRRNHLGEGEFLIVFSLGKDRAVAGSELHTNFVASGAILISLGTRRDSF